VIIAKHLFVIRLHGIPPPTALNASSELSGGGRRLPITGWFKKPPPLEWLKNGDKSVRAKNPLISTEGGRIQEQVLAR